MNLHIKWLIIPILAISSDYILVNASTPITFITFNIRREGKEKTVAATWKNRKNDVCSWLTKQHADIIGLQEAGPSQITDIKVALGDDYAWVGRGRNQRGIVRHFCQTDEHCPIFFNRIRFHLINTGTFWLNKDMKPYHPGWGALLNRICTWVYLEEKTTHKTFFVFNTHLDNKKERARQEGLQLILKQMLVIAPTIPHVLMGDFNAPIDQPPLATIIDHHPYTIRNSEQNAHYIISNTRTMHTHIKKGKYSTIDHILFIGNAWNIIEHQVYWPSYGSHELSDHAPVIATTHLNSLL